MCVSEPKLQGLFKWEEWGSNPPPKHSPSLVQRIKTKTRDSRKKEKKNRTTLVCTWHICHANYQPWTWFQNQTGVKAFWICTQNQYIHGQVWKMIFFQEKKPGTRTSMVYPKAETSPPLEERISKFKKTCA
jgi:hypothetical protein